MPCVIPKAKETNAVPRRPYTWKVRPERRAMATSMAHKGRASERELVLM